MFGFTIAEKEHCYLENEPRGRAEITGAAGRGRQREGKGKPDGSQKTKQSKHRQNLLARGPGVTLPISLNNKRALWSPQSLRFAPQQQSKGSKETWSISQEDAWVLICLTFSLRVPQKSSASLTHKVEQPQITKQNNKLPQSKEVQHNQKQRLSREWETTREQD